jgi:predicted permease
MAEHQAFDDDNLYKLSIYMISLIEQFQPPVMDKKVQEWKESMIETLKHPLVYSEFLGIFLRSVFNMIQSIMKYLEIAEKDLI